MQTGVCRLLKTFQWFPRLLANRTTHSAPDPALHAPCSHSSSGHTLTHSPQLTPSHPSFRSQLLNPSLNKSFPTNQVWLKSSFFFAPARLCAPTPKHLPRHCNCYSFVRLLSPTRVRPVWTTCVLGTIPSLIPNTAPGRRTHSTSELSRFKVHMDEL